MKYLNKRVLFFLISFFSILSINAQSTRVVLSVDSLAAKETRFLTQKLNLTLVQQNSVHTIAKKFHGEIFALRSPSSDSIARKLALNTARKTQQQSLKAVLSQGQWEIYQKEEKAKREAFLARAKEKKVRVSELD